MGGQSSRALILPPANILEALALERVNPQSRFALLPRDILEYVLRPYLTVEAPTQWAPHPRELQYDNRIIDNRYHVANTIDGLDVFDLTGKLLKHIRQRVYSPNGVYTLKAAADGEFDLYYVWNKEIHHHHTATPGSRLLHTAKGQIQDLACHKGILYYEAIITTAFSYRSHVIALGPTGQTKEVFCWPQGSVDIVTVTDNYIVLFGAMILIYLAHDGRMLRRVKLAFPGRSYRPRLQLVGGKAILKCYRWAVYREVAQLVELHLVETSGHLKVSQWHYLTQPDGTRVGDFENFALDRTGRVIVYSKDRVRCY